MSKYFKGVSKKPFKTKIKNKVKLTKSIPATERQLEFLRKFNLNFQKNSISSKKASKLINKIKTDIKNSGKYISLECLAKDLNNNLPKSEQWFLEQLKIRELKLDLKQNIVVGKYIADFINEQEKIIIEIDGKIHEKPEVLTKDVYKDQYLIEIGYKVIRIIHEDYKSLDDGLKYYLNLIYKKSCTVPQRDRVQKITNKNKCDKCKKKFDSLNKFYYCQKVFHYCNFCFGRHIKTVKPK